MKAFTLIEFVIILIVVSIMAVLSVVTIRSVPDNTLALAAKKVSFDMGYVRERAMATAKRHKIYFSSPGRIRAGFANYTLITNPQNNAPFDINIQNTYADVSFSNYSVIFDSLGRATYTTHSSILLTKGSSQQYIKINRQTGRVYVQ